ncbi:hypothetical protein K0504_07750 [Neiella marina]|uniref:DUF2946 domain-containing protein n=1 Tax=Neiella holothuriorum TaxID=2870530 RepID=A0ABS7EGW7_9GAMM|nr:hypothetical protein [Neiella holothuriorum]MBW8190927.1 hypothetical protein [Neiella holothuriorum]
MFRKFFVSLLTLLVVLQSGLAIAYTYEPHQSDLEHYQTNHSHQHAEGAGVSVGHIETASHAENIDQPANDCHQCGHCHGHTSAALVVLIPTAPYLPSVETPVDFLPSQTNYLPIPLFRPPIA